MTANVEPSPITIKSTAERHELGELGTDSAKCYTKNLKDTQIHKILWPNPCFRWRSGARQHRIRGGNFKSKKNGLHTLFWHTSWQLVAHVLAANDIARRSWKGRSRFQGPLSWSLHEGRVKSVSGTAALLKTPGGVLEG